MFHKDTLRLIKNTFNRFFSLVMIVFIGVAFMMGLFSTRQIMEDSVDLYDDSYHLQDIQIYSSYGFNEKDIAALHGQEYIERVFPSRLIDCYSENKDGTVRVTRAEEISRDVDQFVLTDGRMPENGREVLILNNGSLHPSAVLGESLKLYLEDANILGSLKYMHYTVVGVVTSPAYMAKTLGTGTLRNLDLEMVLYLPDEDFLSEYYTTVYLTFRDAAALDSFSREYDDFITEEKAELQAFANTQQDVLKESLLADYEKEIADGEQELAEKKAEAELQFKEAKEELDNANIQLIAAENQLTTLQQALATAQGYQQDLYDRYNRNAGGVYARIGEIEAQAGRDFNTVYTELLADYGSYQTLKNLSSDQTQSGLSSRIQELQSAKDEAAARLSALQEEKAGCEAVLNDPEKSEEEKESAQQRLLALQPEIDATQSEVTLNEELISSLSEVSVLSAEEAKAAKESLDQKYGGNLEGSYSEYTQLQRDKLIYDALKQEISAANTAVGQIQGEMAGMRQQITSGKAAYEEGKRKYDESLLEYEAEIEKAEAEIRKAKQDLEELPEAQWMLLDRNSHYSSSMFAANAEQMGAIGIALPILFYLVAALVCMTTMTRLVDEQRGQIGIFRALGFSKAKIISKYIFYALLATLAGSIPGIFAGMALFPTVIYETWRLMYLLPQRQILFPLQNVVLCFLLFSGLMSLVTFFVVNATLKEVPSQLMRPKAPKTSKKIFLEKIPFLWRRLSFTSKITARNLIRYKSRFIMTVVGIAGCTALLIVGWGIKDSIGDVVDLQFGDIFAYDYVVNLEDDKHLNDFVAALKKDLDNEYVVPYASYSSKVYLDEEEDKTLTVMVLDAREAQDILRLRKASDHKTEIRLKNSGVIISQKFARNHDLKAGDTITIESSTGIKREVRISEICEMYFQHYLYISEEYYDVLFEEPLHPTHIAVTNSTDADFSSIKEMEGCESIVDFGSVIVQFTNMIQALDVIILVIIITAGSLAFVVLINLTQVNISERVREIATLKVLGFRNNEVDAYIFKEIFLLTLFGAFFGIPLGILEHHFIMNVINMEMVMFGSEIKLPSYLYAIGITLIFSLIVLFFTRRPLRRIDMIESLKSVE